MRLPRKNAPDEHKARAPIEVNRFRISIPQAGYCWLQDEAKPFTLGGKDNERKLGVPPYMSVNVSKHAEPAPDRDHFPLTETPDLFVRFRDIALGPEAILEFANQYGWIGNTGIVSLGSRGMIPAVGISKWYEEIQAMIVADHLWQCIQNDDRRTLRNYLTWHRGSFNVQFEIGIDRRKVLDKKDPFLKSAPSGWEALRRSYAQWLIQAPDVEALQALGMEHADVIWPARLALMTIINSRLDTLCHPRLYLDQAHIFAERLTPVNLLGCIWLQFSLLLIGQLKLRRCVICKEAMDVTESRSTRIMHDKCSKKLRMQRYKRNRKLRA